MTGDLAGTLYRTGRAHAAAACLLYAAAVQHASVEDLADPVDHVFNGQNSLSIMHLLGLGMELMLKAAVVMNDAGADETFLRDKIGHDLLKAISEAEKRGFTSTAPYLADIAKLLHDPYRKHWLRYGRPDQFALPGDFDQVVAMLEGMETELGPNLGSPAPPPNAA
ncbi:hypothetical protein [Novosphingobium terrae]|uniref:hypothetical protein n=1 Tax=Novosphingobium terrae TaxID=2726189 RepID=UPI001981AFC9|nr:hypothetical protein [Novosphingobium terrae]